MHPVLARIDPTRHPQQTGKARACALEAFAIVEIKGADAVSFLQGQVTNDIAGAPAGQARLAGYCTAQGRLLATFVMWREPQTQAQDVPTVRAIVRADIAPALVKRLGMFVLRAKAKLAVVPLAVAGMTSRTDTCAALESALGQPLPRLPWQVLSHESGTWIAVPGNPVGRWWWVAPANAPEACEALASHLSAGDPAQWQAEDIEAGLPWIQAATQDLFIPQTVNLDLIDGVSFTKGCYPGQEIVARSHYRGTLKRRMALGTLEGEGAGAVIPATDLFDANATGEPCGRIINVATAGGVTVALFEATFDAVAHGALHVASLDGPRVTPRALPYDTRPAPRTT